ncbi:hypothetical protein [Azohydromonas lata]|uniref:Uncharacterized protein n=1 Tax=Azohydromonas lata TaxID=45677 RepID=A0ABU5IHN5_9BURK|nr:hypothetical protein [Azohydromonas lata]MDZ5458656.1 hypothetical protein [Azohydromonas lata]
MKQTFSGSLANGELSHWKEILQQWCNLIEQWCVVATPDRPWWHLEISNAGLISTAAIQCGHASLVESAVSKTGNKNSRSDLWIKFSQPLDSLIFNTEEFIELKISVVHGKKVNLSGHNNAIKDAIAVDWPCRAKIAACIFIVKPDDRGSEIYFQEVVTDVQRKTNAEAIAWSFPSAARDIPASTGIFEPGIILTLKLVGHQTAKEYCSHALAGNLESTN